MVLIQLLIFKLCWLLLRPDQLFLLNSDGLISICKASEPQNIIRIEFCSLHKLHFWLVGVFLVVAEIAATAVLVWCVVAVRGVLIVVVFCCGTSSHVLLLSNYVNSTLLAGLAPVADICSTTRTEGLADQPSFNALRVKQMQWVAW